MERAPALLPPRLDSCRDHLVELRLDARLSGFVRVGGELDLAGPLDLLEPTRRKNEEACSRDLRLDPRDADGNATKAAVYRSALFRRRKNPSSSSSGT